MVGEQGRRARHGQVRRMVSLAVGTGGWSFLSFQARSSVMRSSTLDADCVFVAICGHMPLCLAAKVLYNGFSRFKFFPINLNVLDKSNVIDLRQRNSRCESYSINWVFCMCWDFRV